MKIIAEILKTIALVMMVVLCLLCFLPLFMEPQKFNEFWVLTITGTFGLWAAWQSASKKPTKNHD